MLPLTMTMKSLCWCESSIVIFNSMMIWVWPSVLLTFNRVLILCNLLQWGRLSGIGAGAWFHKSGPKAHRHVLERDTTANSQAPGMPAEIGPNFRIDPERQWLVGIQIILKCFCDIVILVVSHNLKLLIIDPYLIVFYSSFFGIPHS